MRCLIDPELKPSETDLVHFIYQHAAKTLTKVGHLPPAAFFHPSPIPSGCSTNCKSTKSSWRCRTPSCD